MIFNEVDMKMMGKLMKRKNVITKKKYMEYPEGR